MIDLTLGICVVFGYIILCWVLKLDELERMKKEFLRTFDGDDFSYRKNNESGITDLV